MNQSDFPKQTGIVRELFLLNFLFPLLIIGIAFFATASLLPDTIKCKRNRQDAKPITLNGTIIEANETGWSNYKQEYVYKIKLDNGIAITYQGICSIYEKPKQDKYSKARHRSNAFNGIVESK